MSGVGIGMGGRKKAIWSTEAMVRKLAVGGRCERPAMKAAQYLAIVKRMGGMASILWSSSIGVVWNVLLIHRTASF